MTSLNGKATDPRVVSMFTAPGGNRELILVVDDNLAVRETVIAMLSTHHYRVLSAGDGVEAVKCFAAHSAEIALVITDVDMPNLGGVALARRLTQLRPDLRLLMISGSSDDETYVSLTEAAANLAPAFLLKPFNTKVLLEKVHQLLQPLQNP